MLMTGPFAGHLRIRSKHTLPIVLFNMSQSHLLQNHRFPAFRRFVHVSHSFLDINQSYMIVARTRVAAISGHMLSLQPAPFAKRVVISLTAKNPASASLIFLSFLALSHLHATKSTLRKCSIVTNIARQRHATASQQ